MGHSSTIPTHFEPAEAVFLVLSNLPIIFPVWAALHRNAIFEAAFFTGVGIISSLYHLCAGGIWCFTEEEHMAIWDHVFAQGGIAVIVVWVLAFDAPRYQGKRIIEQMYLFVLFFAIITITVINDRESVWTLVWIIGMSVFTVVVKWAFIDWFRVYVRDYNWYSSTSLPPPRGRLGPSSRRDNKTDLGFRYALVIGVGVVLVGLSLYFIGTANNYWWTHAVWHMIVFIGIGFMVLGRVAKVRKDRAIHTQDGKRMGERF